jgi:hypothetical protein
MVNDGTHGGKCAGDDMSQPEGIDNLQSMAEQTRSATKPANWLRTLNIYSVNSKRRQTRFNRLALFTPRLLYDQKTGLPTPQESISHLRPGDPADLELMLERRDRYLAVRKSIAGIHKALEFAEQMEPKELAIITNNLRGLENDAERQIQAMEEMMWRHRDREHQVMVTLAKLVSEGARLNMLDRQHQDKMRLERAGKPSNFELEMMAVDDAENDVKEAEKRLKNSQRAARMRMKKEEATWQHPVTHPADMVMDEVAHDGEGEPQPPPSEGPVEAPYHGDVNGVD